MMTSSAPTTSVSRARFGRFAAGTLLVLSLSAAPAFAAETGDEAATEAEGHGEEHAEEGGKIELAEGPRDRVGLIVLGFLGAITIGGAVNAARQLRGKRPQASGEFRWR